MNVYDSEQIAKRLKPLGYETTPLLAKADLIIVNTCAIRSKAEQKAFSFLGRLASLKRRKPDLIIGIGGCVAQQEGEKILERLSFIDLVFGTHAVVRLPGMIMRIESKRCRIVDVGMQKATDSIEPFIDFKTDGSATSFVTIMQGCDNYCSYCVVPYVRGRERSRDPESIIKEIQVLVESGVREVTLLGQNVNSYGKKEGLCSFTQLLSRVNEIKELERIRFTTSHPKDLSDDLIDGFRSFEKLCNHIHLPVQSGANRILIQMNRKYTREQYLEKIDKLRSLCPDIAITSDIIVGFPGETRAEFEETIDLIKTVVYDSLYAFKYSDRPNATAAGLPGKITEPEKKERLQTLLDLQESFTIQKNESLLGTVEFILVEGLSKKQTSRIQKTSLVLQQEPRSGVQWTGRTTTNKIVNFFPGNNSIPHNDNLTGRIAKVRIEKAFAHSLWGKLLQIEPKARGLKGENCYAA
jgi:tRNA-2-methylthio-N6-dimethylallyladenosine synthase